MLSSIFVAATVSKAPFYIAGAVFAIWAVVLSAIGLRNPKFPGSLTGQRGVIAVSFVLMLITIAMAIHTSTFE